MYAVGLYKPLVRLGKCRTSALVGADDAAAVQVGRPGLRVPQLRLSVQDHMDETDLQ